MDIETRRDMESMAEWASTMDAYDRLTERRARRHRSLRFWFSPWQIVDDPSTNSEPGLGSLHRRPRSGAGGHIPNTSSDRGTRVGPEPDRTDTPAGTESDTARVTSPLNPDVPVPSPGARALPHTSAASGLGTGAAGSIAAPPATHRLVSGSSVPVRPHHLTCSEASRISAALNRHT